MSKHHDIWQWCVNNKSQVPDDGPDISILSRWDFYILQLSAIKTFQANTIIIVSATQKTTPNYDYCAHDVSVNMFFYYHVDRLDERCLFMLLEKTDPDRTRDILVLLCFGGVARVCSSESTEKE